MLAREGGEGEHVRARLVEQAGGVREALLELVDHSSGLSPDRLLVGLGEDRADQGGDQGLGRLRHPGQQAAHEVGSAALPARAGEDRGDGLLEAEVVIGDDQANAGATPGDQTAQEAGPGRAIFGGEDLDAQDLAVAVGVDAGRDGRADVDHAATIPAALGEGVDPNVGGGTAVEGAVAELVDHPVQALGHDRDLGLGGMRDAQALDQPLHPAGGDAGQVSLRDHADQGSLRPPPRLQEPVRGVAALAQLGDGERDRADPGVPLSFPVAVARVGPLARALAVAGTAELLGFGAHQLLPHRRQPLPKQIRVGLLQLLAQPGGDVTIHTGVGHRFLRSGGESSGKDDRWPLCLRPATRQAAALGPPGAPPPPGSGRSSF